MRNLIITMTVPLLFALTGCVSISYEPETGAVRYQRLGNQSFEGLEYTDAEGRTVKIQKQNAETQALETVNRALDKLP